MKRTAKITDILRWLDDVPTQAYISNALQVADILEWVLGQTKNRDITVYQTTFSISEEFLRRTYFIKRDNPGVRFIVVIDRKALQKTVQLWRFIAQVYDEVYISDNHSKILLVETPDSRAALVTSQNLTRGNRAESAVLTIDPAITEALKRDFEELKRNNSAPMHDIMPTAAERLPALPDRHAGDTEITEEIERLAGYFVPISDIATILEVDPGRLRACIADEEHPWSLAYRKGKAKAKVAIRAQEMEFAKVGSPLGLQSVRENLLMMETDED